MITGIRANAVRPRRGVPRIRARGLSHGQRRQRRRLLTIAVQRPYRRALLLYLGCRLVKPPQRQSYLHTWHPIATIYVPTRKLDTLLPKTIREQCWRTKSTAMYWNVFDSELYKNCCVIFEEKIIDLFL